MRLPDAQISSKFLVHEFGFQTPALLKVQRAIAKQRPLPWQPHDGEHDGNVMRSDHSSFVQIGPLIGEIQHFQQKKNIFQNGDRSPS